MQFASSSPGNVFSALRTGRLRAYANILVVGSGVRLFGLVSQFLVLVIMSRVLSKENFGDLMTAFGFYRLAATALGVGGSLVLLFHVSRRPDDKAAEIRLHRSAAALSAIASAAVAVLGYLAAEPIANVLQKPGLAIWFEQLAPFAVFSTLLVVSTGALEGRSRVSDSILFGEAVPNAVRIVLVPMVAWLDLPQTFIAHALTISVLVPWLISAHRLWDRSVRGMTRWTAWEFSYCGKFVTATLFANQLGAVDILVAGTLFPSDVVADYAIATRIAALFGFFQLTILKRFAPAAGRLIQTQDLGALRREVELCRRLMIGCGTLTIAGILITVPFLLPVFGRYDGAMMFIILLAIPVFVQSFYGASDRLLIIAGQANIPLVMTASTFFLLTTMPFVTAPWLGLTSIPAAMIVAMLLFNPIVAVRVHQLFAIRTIHTPDVISIAAGTVALGWYAMEGSLVSELIACAIVLAIGLSFVASAISLSRASPQA
jgi:O-antigen/teichoic acid export membrane protein